MLQNLIRRDPPSYREEFVRQHQHYEAQRAIFMQLAASGGPGTGPGAGAANTEAFCELIGFMAQVATAYSDLTARFPDDLAQLLLKQQQQQHGLQEKLVQSLVLLRNKGAIGSASLLQTLFPVLTATASKALRGQIYRAIVAEMRSANARTKSHRLNKMVQAVLFELVAAGRDDAAAAAGLWAVKLTRELWRRGVWDDGRAVEIMKEAALCANAKVVAGGLRFFLGADQEKEELANESDDDDAAAPDLGRVKHQLQINKKKGSTKHRKLEKAQQQLKKVFAPGCSMNQSGSHSIQSLDRKRKTGTSHTR